MTTNNPNTGTHSTILSFSDIDWEKVSGPVPVRMSNDYLFLALMQRNNKVLKALVCSLLHLDRNTISSVVITNPIELGKAPESKRYILDIRVEIDGRLLVNLEMQVINESDWTERSLCYLCRSFDNLNKGEEYIHVKPVVHIGILDYTLFRDAPEFYATYQLLNIRSHKLYSDRLRLSVLELNQIALATEEDKRYRIDHWARLFKATTWEELKMLARNNTDIQEAVTTTYQLTQDEKIRQQCEAREDYYRHTCSRERLLKEATEARDQLAEEVKDLSSKNEELSTKNEELSSKYEQAASQNEQLFTQNEELSTQNEELSTQNEELSTQNEELSNQNEQLSSKYEQTASQNEQLSAELEKLRQELAAIRKAAKMNSQ